MKTSARFALLALLVPSFFPP
jgi:MFS family permease